MGSVIVEEKQPTQHCLMYQDHTHVSDKPVGDDVTVIDDAM